jgi:5S rRNA maturation endonuclease (ribonuclease M5)
MLNPKISDVLPLLRNVKQTGNGYTSLCPAHEDHKNSLSITEGDNGKLLFNCFAECEFADIKAALGISFNGNGNQKKIVAVYKYTDEKGNLLYENIRYDPKDFRQRHIDSNGREVWNLDGVRRVPYRLQDLVKLPKHYDFVMAEGEKDCETLAASDLIATNHKNWKPEFNYLLKGKKVVLFQDHDRAGVSQVEKTIKLIFGSCKAIKIVDCFADENLSDKHGKDVSDYLKEHTKDEVLELIRKTPDWKPSADQNVSNKPNDIELKVVCLTDVIAEKIVWLWNPFIPIGEFTILEGIEGLGKSWTCCAIACAVADGKKLPFSESEPITPGNVLMLSAEDSLSHTVKPRLVAMKANLDRIFAIDDVFSFSDFKDFIKFEAIVAEYEPRLIIIDPMFSYTGGKDLNQESSSRPIARKLIEIAQKYQCAIIGVRHIGKSKGNGDARAAGLGSISWRASARSVLMVGKDEESNEIGIVHTKSNLSEKSKIAVGFELRNGQFYWCSQPSSLTAERMLSQPKDDESKAEQSEATEFLREALTDGERFSKDVQREARDTGITQYALRKARAILNVECFKKGGTFGGEKGWYIRLPKNEDNNSKTEDADSSENRHLQSNQSDKTSYSSGLAEFVENTFNKQVQPNKSTSSNESVPQWQMKVNCKCGESGYVGQECQKCGEVIIPF